MTVTPSQSQVSIKATFIVPKYANDSTGGCSITHQFDSNNCEPATIGIPFGQTPQKPAAGDYKYSGMQDDGELPLPREGGEFALLIGCVNEARKASNALLTEIINKGKGQDRKRR
mmetsp:Transcript_23338/g.32824  ORF Transcript_23338/g.32824 Transcript_23338/m.32824 type:complete len:115 (-) Transcript_23338:362-706(-)